MRRPLRTGSLNLVTDISTTPLMDLVFILLFAFMVVAPLVMQSDTLLLPLGSASRSDDAPTEMTVLTLKADGGLQWDGQALAAEELVAKASAAIAENAALGVAIQMDSDVPVQKLVTLMDALRRARVTRTAIVVNNAAEVSASDHQPTAPK